MVSAVPPVSGCVRRKAVRGAGLELTSEAAGSGTDSDWPAAQQGTAAGRLRSGVGPSVDAASTGSHSVNDRNRDARVTSRIRFVGVISTAALKTSRSPTRTTCLEARVAAV